MQDYERRLHETRVPGGSAAEPYFHWLQERVFQGGELLIGELDGNFAGFVAGWIEQAASITETPDSNRFGYISDVYVLPAYRGKRIATQLLKAIESRLARSGITRLRINALANNKSAWTSYERSGFRAYETMHEKRLASNSADPVSAISTREASHASVPLIEAEDATAIPDRVRRKYIDSLQEPQEFYVENLVRTGRKVLIRKGTEVIGYAVVNGLSVVEFCINDNETSWITTAFENVLRHCGASQALCKTFDPLMVMASASLTARTRTVAHLFREVLNPDFTEDPSIAVRPGREADINTVLRIHDGFFDGGREIEDYINEGGLYLYSSADAEPLGCGIFKPVIKGRDAWDVGMVVAKAHRRKGLGSYIAAHLKHHCLTSGRRPICGCSTDNVASRRALENAGFATRHSLIEFSY
jgi:GNAT superfamily N-acetyltransferase